ncbi:hypothetical protein N5D77_16915 [Comamonas thiooxydans]|uniref:Uncharacterized protein n=1 Tax=Comamonas thiooxydans TaxID=363952 RepID=A0AA42TTR0_9BURK|nr:hypothetical protein [Comamonas thiooxydans]MDH1333513.1 hypothetical protein [Comamonas thiooxydans]MDH1738715.1 hypothetical protein [Comamonas thiooxydans]MDH1788252.1 hypothetical protein [Comamonas thiooxydans]
MDANRLTHIYGITSLIVGALGIFVGFRVGADWKEIALFASGWITAILISFHLKSSMRFHGQSSDKVSEANGIVKDLMARCQELETQKISLGDKFEFEKESLNKDFNYQLDMHLQKIEQLKSLVEHRTQTLDFLVAAKISNFAIARKEDDTEKVNP